MNPDEGRPLSLSSLSPTEAARRIKRIERRIKFKLVLLPLVSWSFTLASSAFVLTSSATDFALAWFGTCSLVSAFGNVFTVRAFEHLQRRKVFLLWNGMEGSGKVPTETRQFGKRLSNLYNGELPDELVPLYQAIRLLDVYHRQREYLHRLDERINDLTLLYAQLAEKIRRLSQLDEVYDGGETKLAQFKAEIAGVEAVRNPIEASCHRLDTLLISIEKAHYIRQLNQEINGIAAQMSGTPMRPLSAPDESLADLERQIGCEIETFLQLERDTDKQWG